jgi:hypothetical protein
MYNIIIVIVGQSIENVIIFLNISQARKAEAPWAGATGIRRAGRKVGFLTFLTD